MEIGKDIHNSLKILQTLSPGRKFWVVKDVDVTYLKFDHEKKYYYVNNWVLIGSMGDPKTWEGVDSTRVRKDSEDGLAGCLVDLNIL